MAQKSFMDYFKKDGMNIVEIDAARRILLAIYSQTAKEWTPQNCRNIPTLTDKINRILSAIDGNVFTEFRPQHWNHSHFFLVSRVNSRDFIFDPTGVPTDYSREIETITPYFGLLESASGNHRLVYDKKTPMDDWGTR